MLDDFVKVVGHTRDRLFSEKPMAERANMTGRNVIVTGAARQSIGYEVAKTLAAWGANVTVTSLGDVEPLQQALRHDLREMAGEVCPDESRVVARHMDLCDPSSVANFVAWYGDRHDRLDVLVNNAGVFKDIAGRSKTPILSEDGIEIHWRTNFLGTFHLTRLLLPMLAETGRLTRDARVVVTSSHVYEDGRNELFFCEDSGHYNSWRAYSQAKLALVHLSFEIQRRYAKECNVQSVVLHPGSVRTNLTSSGLDGNPLLKRVHRLFDPLLAPFFLTLEHGAQTTITCAARSPLKGGRYYERCAVAEAAEQANDEAVAKRLWEAAENWVAGLTA